MSNLERTICYFISALMMSCASNQNGLPVDDKEVLREILPLIIDSMYVEISYEMTPAPVRIDSSSAELKFIFEKKDPSLKEWIRQQMIREKQTANVISFVIDDTIRGLDESEIKAFAVNNVLNNDSLNIHYKLDLKSVGKLDGINLILATEYIPSPEPDPNFRVLSKLVFSRIVFNEQCDFGMLTCKYQCGLGCGRGYRIFIRNFNGNWAIDRIEFVYMV